MLEVPNKTECWAIKNYYGLGISEDDPLEADFDNSSFSGDEL